MNTNKAMFWAVHWDVCWASVLAVERVVDRYVYWASYDDVDETLQLAVERAVDESVEDSAGREGFR